MKIRYVTGNLLDGKEKVIVHGCNAQGVMGSGVAAAIRATYPKAYEIYRQEYDANGLQIGDIIWAICGERWIANAITQQDYGRVPGRRYVHYEAVRRCFQRLEAAAEASHATLDPIREVAMPLIGAGLAQGKWSIISAIIEEEAKSFEPVVYTLDGTIPD